MNIVKERHKYFQSLERKVVKQLKNLFNRGWQAFSSQPITSLRSNARKVTKNWKTASTKITRVTLNLKFLLLFPILMLGETKIKPTDCIAIDFSDFGNSHMVLMFAKQTHKGRGIPIYFEILEKHNARGYQNTFIIQALRNFELLLGFKPKLVFDRGFACPSIISFLKRNSWLFVIRIKKIKTVINLTTGQRLKVKDSQDLDFLASAYDFTKLRIVISDHKEDMDEPWYLVTNDFTSSRKTIIQRYYYRFEIEELFRDGKRLLGLEGVNFKIWQSLAVTLWFVMAGMWFFWWCEENLLSNQKQEKELRQSLGLSIIRYWFERLQSQFYHLALKTALENSA
jgi:hypothetical protein